uniref:HYR-like domain-containing protein n=1 Tax=uncultured Winogradskyella sp. TaxID=395353 RepID=UPI0035160174
MKTILRKSQIKNLLLLLVILSSSLLQAQVQETFTPRFNQTVKGDFTMIANNMLSRSATGDYNGSDGNHDFTDNVYVDIDGNTGIGATTFNSSNAIFNNPEPSLTCLSIKKAYLYWAAADKEPTSDLNSENQPDWNFNDVKLMLPGETNYTTYTADEVIFRGRDTHFSNDPYICVKDITNQVTALGSPYGMYQVANVEAKTGSLIAHPNGNTGTSGGWQIVFVYESPLMPSKNISIFDGYAHVTSSINDFDINFSGFQTIPLGPVSTKVMIGSLEGDRDLSGDRLQIRNVVGNFVDISAPQRASSNFFNSRITVGASNFIDRSPASLNTLGFDAAIFDLDNGGAFNTIIGNNQTSATLRLTSNQETYGLYLLGLSVDVWAPDLNPIEMFLSSGNNPANPGDTLGYSFSIENNGNDNAVNLQISAILPPQVEFNGADNLPAGVSFTYNPVTRELVFLVDDGLVNVGSPELDIDFEIFVKDECYFLEDNCDLSIDLQFEATYNGILNPNQQSTLSSANLDECQVGIQDPTIINVNQPGAALWANPANDLDRTINCDDTDGLNAAQALEPTTDKCNFTLTKTSGSFVADPSCPNTGTYTNTWTFTDACGRTSPPYVQVITIADPDGPTFNEPLPGDVTVECDDIPDAPTLTASTSCGTVTVDYNEVRTDGSCDSEYTLTRTWTATDNCGVETIHTQTITVQDTVAPTFNETLPTDVTVECDAVPIAETLTASDNCGTATVAFNETTTAGTCDNEFILTRTWTATDACGNETVHTQTITVQDTVAPTFNETLPTDVTVECDAVPTAETLTASDNCGTATVDFNETTTPGACDNEYTLTRTWTATDACGNETVHTQTITVQDTTAPSFNETLPTDVTVECDAVPTAETLTASDNCGTATVDFNETTTAGTCDNDYTLTRTWTATDACGNETVHTQTITVQDTVAPTFNETLPTDVTVECDAVPTAETLTASDNCGTATVDFNETTTPGACDNEYTLTRTWTATDACGNETVHTQTITVQDTTAPSFNETLPTDVTVECDAVPTAETLTASDNCGTATVDFNETTTAGTCDNDYTLTRTWTATDACGNETVHTQTITVQDTVAPTFNETLPTDITVECDAVPTAETLTASDNCGTATVAFNETTTAGACDNEFTLTRTWTATDACGNETVHTQTITVQDNVGPTFIETLPTDVTVECDDVPTAETLTASDNCGTATVAFNETTTAGACDNEFTLTRTWTATDACGNETVHTQTITVVDTTAPTITVPADVTIECTEDESSANTGVATGADTCGTVTVTESDVETAACGNTKTIVRTWTVTDECGNSTSADQTITVVDTTPPTIDNTNTDDIVIQCGVTPDGTLEAWLADNAGATANDTCGTVTWTNDYGADTDVDCANGAITVIFTATDECGNASTTTATYSIIDTVAPVITVPADVTIECTEDESPANTGTATATDDCTTPVVTFSDSEVTACGNTKTITRTWTATDACGNSVSQDQIIIVEDTTPPTISVPADVTIECTEDESSANTGVATGADTCGTVTVTESDVETVACGNTKTIVRTWTVTDECGNSTSADQTITVVDTTPPTIDNTNTDDIVIQCGVTPDGTLEAWLADNAGATANDTCGTVTWTNDYGADTDVDCANGAITVTFTATDECGNASTTTATYSIIDTVAPVITVPADVTIECTEDESPANTGTATATDDCTTPVVTFSDSEVTACGNTKTITRTWTATDACGNSVSQDQIITVEDTTPPTISVPTDVTIECTEDESSANTGVATGADTCGTVTISESDVETAACGNTKTIVRTWTVTDECGNSTSADQTITVVDTTAPTISVPADVTIECTEDESSANTGVATGAD